MSVTGNSWQPDPGMSHPLQATIGFLIVKKKKGAWDYSSDQIGKVSAFKSHICGRDKDHTCNLSCGDKFFEVKYNWVKRLKSEGVDTVF